MTDPALHCAAIFHVSLIEERVVSLAMQRLRPAPIFHFWAVLRMECANRTRHHYRRYPTVPASIDHTTTTAFGFTELGRGTLCEKVCKKEFSSSRSVKLQAVRTPCIRFCACKITDAHDKSDKCAEREDAASLS